MQENLKKWNCNHPKHENSICNNLYVSYSSEPIVCCLTEIRLVVGWHLHPSNNYWPCCAHIYTRLYLMPVCCYQCRLQPPASTPSLLPQIVALATCHLYWFLLNCNLHGYLWASWGQPAARWTAPAPCSPLRCLRPTTTQPQSDFSIWHRQKKAMVIYLFE